MFVEPATEAEYRIPGRTAPLLPTTCRMDAMAPLPRNIFIGGRRRSRRRSFAIALACVLALAAVVAWVLLGVSIL